MIERLKRNWTYNRLYMVMFCLAFISVISLSLYGLMYVSRTLDNEVTRVKSSYRYMYQVIGMASETDDLEISEIPLITRGNLYVCASIPVRNDYLELANNVWVLFYRNEPLQEVLLSGSVPEQGMDYDAPCVLAGIAYQEDIYTEDGTDYIKLGDLECKVSGILRPISEEVYDTRLILFWDTLSEEEKGKISKYFIADANGILFEVYSEQEPDSAELSELKSIVDKYARDDTISEFYGNDIYLSSYESECGRIRIIYAYLLLLVLLVALICLIFLTYVWSNMKKREWIILLVNGYLIKDILLECAAEILGYELIGLLLGVLIWLGSGLMQGQGYEISLTLKYFSVPGVFLALLLPCFLASISAFRLRNVSPRTYLQAE